MQDTRYNIGQDSFVNFHDSSTVVPKGSTCKFRVIHDLSFPENQSVNSNVPRENSAVQYDSIDQVVDLVQKFGREYLTAKTDIKDAFRIIPIDPSDYYLLGFTWKYQYYFYKYLSGIDYQLSNFRIIQYSSPMGHGKCLQCLRYVPYFR